MSKPRETLYPTLIVMDEKGEGAAIAQARRCRRRGDHGVKIMNPFGIPPAPHDAGAGRNLLADLDRRGPVAQKRREGWGRRRKGRGGAAPNKDGDG